jgi:hypothetical protein
LCIEAPWRAGKRRKCARKRGMSKEKEEGMARIGRQGVKQKK